MKSDDPDDSVPSNPSTVKKASHKMNGTSQKEEKRVPLYFATTASMRAKTLPTKQYVKRESRLPARMMLRKCGVVPSVPVAEKEQRGAVDTAPEETVEKQKETTIPVSVDRGGDVESSQVKEEEKLMKSSLAGSTSGTQKPSISTSPDRAVSLPAKKEEEDKATPVIGSMCCSFLME